MVIYDFRLNQSDLNKSLCATYSYASLHTMCAMCIENNAFEIRIGLKTFSSRCEIDSNPEEEEKHKLLNQ